MADPDHPADPRLAELHRQRDAVAQHLAWLEGEIAAAEGWAMTGPADLVPAESAAAPEPRDAPDANAPEPAPEYTPEPVAPEPVYASEPVASEPVVDYVMPEPVKGLTPRETWGCIALVLGLAALIVGSMWILPHLLPMPNLPHPAATAPASAAISDTGH
jgi:hypothetical protein